MGNFQSTGIYDFSQNMSPHHPVSHSPLVSNFITGSSPGTLSSNEVSNLVSHLKLLVILKIKFYCFNPRFKGYRMKF